MSSRQQHGKKFGLLQKRTHEVADSWVPIDLKSRPETINVAPGSREAFEEVSRQLFARVTLLGGLRHLRGSSNISHGFDVMLRTLYMYALVAQQEDMRVSQFRQAAGRDEAFEPVESIALGMSNRLAVRVEHRLQLAAHRWDTDAKVRDKHYGYEDGRFTVKSVSSITREQRLDIIRECLESNMDSEEISGQVSGLCDGGRMGILRPIYHSAVEVAFKDPSLVASLLKKTQ